jgi:hypothetical protein
MNIVKIKTKRCMRKFQSWTKKWLLKIHNYKDSYQNYNTFLAQNKINCLL